MYFTVITTSGREILGSIPFNGQQIDEPIEKIIIEHPGWKTEILEGYAHYFIYNEAVVMFGGAEGKRYAVQIGYMDSEQYAKGFVITDMICIPKLFDLADVHPTTRQEMFKAGRIHLIAP